jgi:hypothetical protein
MKRFTLIVAAACCLLSAHGLMGQNRFLITDSIHVFYGPMPDEEDLDSVAYILKDGIFPICEAHEVYFDAAFSRLAYKTEMIADSCISYDYWRNGRLKKKTVHLLMEENTPVWWSEEMYCENGNLKFKGPSPNQHGIKHYVHFYCNGNKKVAFTQIDENAEGAMTSWYENGLVESEMFFKNNLPEGPFRYYNESGKLYLTEVYRDGILIQTLNHE